MINLHEKQKKIKIILILTIIIFLTLLIMLNNGKLFKIGENLKKKILLFQLIYKIINFSKNILIDEKENNKIKGDYILKEEEMERNRKHFKKFYENFNETEISENKNYLEKKKFDNFYERIIKFNEDIPLFVCLDIYKNYKKNYKKTMNLPYSSFWRKCVNVNNRSI